MKSRIPHPKVSHDSHDRRQQLHQSASNSRAVYESLVLLGAPSIKPDDFDRLYHGPLAEFLLFASEHIKGRKEVVLARTQIHQLRETRQKSHIKKPDDITRPATDKAASLLSGAKQTAEMCKKQLSDQQAVLEQSQMTIDQLKERLNERRRAALLLNILEQKERIRVKRFQEMTEILAKLRTASTEAKTQFEFSNETFRTMLGSMKVPRPLHIPHTRDVLTNLHAYHIRLVQSQNNNESHSEPELLRRLRTVIAHQTVKSEMAGADAENIFRYALVARTRSRQGMRFQSNNKPSGISKGVLNSKLELNKAKQRELQRISDLSIALGFLCEHFISSISIFLEKTSPVLRSSLEEEAPLTRGYIDLLRCLIASNASNQPSKLSFIQEVRDLCRMSGRPTPDEILPWIKTVIYRVHRDTSFFKLFQVPQPPSPTQGQETLLASYEENTRSMQERMVKVLTRKVEKANMGSSLVEDIETLLQETRTIIG